MKIKKIDGKSRNPQSELQGLLKKNFPEIFAEGKVDCQKLKRTLGEDVEANGERYGLSWAGKGDCFRHIQEPTTKTLKPAKDESVDFENTGNLFIEGENLEVLKVLQKSYYGKIKCIYIDPPYNTGNDSFIYPDRFQESQDEYLKRIGDKDEEGNLTKEGMFRKNSKDGGHYHSNWLSMMYPRLFLARNLLRQDGVIFVSIDDNEVHNLRMIMNEIFGEENSLTESPTALIWQRAGSTAGHFANAHEYILCYAKHKESLPFFHLSDYGENSVIEHGALKKISKANPESEITFPAGVEFEGRDAIFEGEIGGSEKEIIEGKMIFEKGRLKNPTTIKAGWGMRDQIISWLNGEETYDSKGQKIIRFYFNKEGMLWYEKERGTIHPKTILSKDVGSTKTGSIELDDIFGFKVFDYPKPASLIKFLFSFSTNDSDIILDFFAGSGTTGHAVMAQNAEDDGNRKFICVQMPESCGEESEAFKAGFKTIADIAKERIRRAGSKLKEEKKNEFDFGFKVFKLDDSNFKVWNGNVKDAEELEKQMLEFIDNVKKESTEENMLWELLLKSGLDPNVAVEKKNVAGDDYFSVDGGKLVVYLGKKLSKEFVEAITQAKPEKMICLDRAFAGKDQLKTNTALSMESAKIDFRVV